MVATRVAGNSFKCFDDEVSTGFSPIKLILVYRSERPSLDYGAELGVRLMMEILTPPIQLAHMIIDK